MMVRISSLALAAVLSASLFACDQPGKQEQNAEGRANMQAQENEQKAAQSAAQAKAEADQKIAQARADFEKSQTDYIQSRQSDLNDLNKDIAKLENKDRISAGQTKAKLDASLTTIRAQRDVFTTDLNALSRATADTWDGMKTKVDGEWDALKKAVDKAP